MLLFFLALGNLLLTFIILGVLRLGQGMESLELVPEKSLVMFYGITDLDRIYKRDGKLEGFDECPVEITGDNGSVHIILVDKEGHVTEPKINVTVSSTIITGVNSFDVRDPVTNHSVFSTDFPNFGLPRGVKKLDIRMAQTRRITSPINASLFLRSETYTRLRGSEGTHMEGREIVWSADQDIYLKSVNGSVILSGREGISVDIKSIPIASGREGGNLNSVQYKVCVCMPEGKVFRVPVPLGGNNKHIGCHNVDLSSHTNPCM